MTSFISLKDTSKALSVQIATCEDSRSRCEADLRIGRKLLEKLLQLVKLFNPFMPTIEREWRSVLQAKELDYKETIAKLQSKTSQYAEEAKKHEKTKSELDRLRHKYNEDQQTLEELGIQLSISKLQMSELKERTKTTGEFGIARAMVADWISDDSAKNCICCHASFSITKRKHHCRSCGEVVCKNCSEHLLPLEGTDGM